MPGRPIFERRFGTTTGTVVGRRLYGSCGLPDATERIAGRCYPRIRNCGNSAGPEDDMADKKKGTIEGGPASDTKATDKGAKKKAAVPEAAGEPAPQAAPSVKSPKIPKLAKKNKSRLPRREKKARQKGR